MLFGWVFASYDLAAAAGGASFDCALSLPRVMGTRTLAGGAVVPTWEIAPETARLRLPDRGPPTSKPASWVYTARTLNAIGSCSVALSRR